MTDIINLGKDLEELKKDIREMTNETKMMEKNSESDVLANLKGIQNNMRLCKNQLETVLEWDQLCASCQEALASEDTEVFSSSYSYFVDGCICIGGYDQIRSIAIRIT